MAKKNPSKEYLNSHVKKPLEVVIKRVLKRKPTDPIPMILSVLEECQGLNNDPLTDQERMELDALRNEYEYLQAKLIRLEGKGAPHVEEESKVTTHQKYYPDDSDTESSGNESDNTLPDLPESK
mmetsp:Transcript_4458/g.4163  ORF Transcript_4458/g.4163 Transcript_4458/m.4163 type:complete len:124 (-) Transcript_4458:916-1287(-)